MRLGRARAVKGAPGWDLGLKGAQLCGAEGPRRHGVLPLETATSVLWPPGVLAMPPLDQTQMKAGGPR